LPGGGGRKGSEIICARSAMECGARGEHNSNWGVGLAVGVMVAVGVKVGVELGFGVFEGVAVLEGWETNSRLSATVLFVGSRVWLNCSEKDKSASIPDSRLHAESEKITHRITRKKRINIRVQRDFRPFCDYTQDVF